MNKYIKFALLVPLFLTMNACEKDFEKVNTNTNESEVADPSFVLTNVLKINVDRYFDVAVNMDFAALVPQHWAKIQYPEEDAYRFRTTTYQLTWNGFYAQGLQDCQDIIDQGKRLNNPNYVAVGTIFRVWLFAALTDLYGDIPYSEAIKVETILTPKYDAQQDVYKGLLAELKTASETITLTGPGIGGDILYGGNLTAWKKFANSLRLRLYMRLTDADPATAAGITALLASGDENFINSNEENAQLVYLGSAPNNNPINENRKTRDDHRISKTIVDKLLALNDPRLAVYADTTESKSDFKTTPNYVGVPNGLSAKEANALGLSATSKVGKYFTAATAPGVLMSYSEVLFIKAEAAARGLAPGGQVAAASLYKDAIAASFEQYGIATNVETYVAQPSVAYDPANFKKSIGEQKWLALFGQSVEAYSEWRRLDYPVLTPAKQSRLPVGKLPLRMIYPANEQSLNLAKYKEAVTRQGADVLTTRVWWDKL